MNPAQSMPSIIPAEIPESFFRGLPDPVLPRARGATQIAVGPMKAMILYDAIIDDIFTNPATTIGATAQRLGKASGTVSLIVRSDFFRARWLQRREQYNQDLNFRLQAKIAQVAEKSLDVTMKRLEVKGETLPLPELNEVNKTLLDRLGYGPQGGNNPAVVIQNNVNAQAGASVTQASPEGLAKAREYLRILEQSNASSGPSPGNGAHAGVFSGPVVEGEATHVET